MTFAINRIVLHHSLNLTIVFEVHLFSNEMSSDLMNENYGSMSVASVVLQWLLTLIGSVG